MGHKPSSVLGKIAWLFYSPPQPLKTTTIYFFFVVTTYDVIVALKSEYTSSATVCQKCPIKNSTQWNRVHVSLCKKSRKFFFFFLVAKINNGLHFTNSSFFLFGEWQKRQGERKYSCNVKTVNPCRLQAGSNHMPHCLYTLNFRTFLSYNQTFKAWSVSVVTGECVWGSSMCFLSSLNLHIFATPKATNSITTT